jgi:hypothetical protein
MLAERIALKPETGIYRRFDALNARHLYLQAELCILEERLREIEIEDERRCKADCPKHTTNYQRMVETKDSNVETQKALIQTMHRKLNEYSE